MPAIAVRRVNPLAETDWDAQLASCPGAVFFHTAAWARVLHETYGFRPVYLVAEDPDGGRALLPLMEIDSWLTGRRGVSLPFTDECRPAGGDEHTHCALTLAALACADDRRWRYLELRGGRGQMGRAPASTRYYGHELELQGNAAALFAGCESSVRRAVRKASGSDLQIEFRRSMEAMRSFHALLCQTRQRHGVPPQPLAFFEQVQRHVLAKNQGWVVLATLHNRPVAAAVFFHHGRSALYKYGASDDSFQHLRPNNLVMWRAIEWYTQAGFTTLDFGRTARDNDGLRRFKLGWGARERSIEYIRYNLRSGDFATARPESPDWQRTVLRRLPRNLLRLIGAAAYRHVG